MGLPLNDSTDRTGIVQLIEDRTNTQSSAGSAYPLATKVRDINLAFARFQMIATETSGRWQFDDANQTDYPVMMINILSGQQDYSFIYDFSPIPNMVLDIYRVEIQDENGNWTELTSIDQEDIEVALPAYENVSGIPTQYDKTSNGIFLYPAPNFTRTDALRVYYARTPNYFVTSDTTKQAGIPDIFHEYLAIRPSYYYCLSKGLPRARDYGAEMREMEQQIREYYGKRQRDEAPQVSVNNSNYIDTVTRYPLL